MARAYLVWLLCLLPSLVLAQYPYRLSAGTYYVTAPSGLQVRASSSLDAPTLGTLPYGQAVAVHACGRSWQEVGPLKGLWAEVRYAGQPGYVFSAYLCSLPAPALDGHSPAACAMMEATGYEELLNAYLRRQAAPPPQLVYETEVPEDAEKVQQLSRQDLSPDLTVWREQFFEHGRTLLALRGDVYQAYAWLAAAMQACPTGAAALQSAHWIRNRRGEVVRIESPDGGFDFEIIRLDAFRVQLALGSGS